MASSYKIGDFVRFQCLCNVLNITNENNTSTITQDLKFVVGDGAIIDQLMLPLQDKEVFCFIVRTDQGDITVPETSILQHQSVVGEH